MTAPPPSAQRFRLDIQGMRALAVGMVVVYHVGWLVPGGFVGVDVFFVISGFLITQHIVSQADRGQFRFGQFYARRAKRILPASFVTLALTVVAALIWVPPLQFDEVFRGAIATALYVPNLLFAIEGTNYLSESVPSLFQHYWSLGIEEQFYVVWPAVMLVVLLLAAKRKNPTRAAIIAIATLILLSLIAGVVATWISQPMAFFLPVTRAWELALGGLLAYLTMRFPALRLGRLWSEGLGWAGILLVVIAAFSFGPETPYPGFAAIMPVAGTLLMIAAGSWGGTGLLAALLSTAPLQFIGKISYSLYLVHWPLLLVPQAAVGWHDPLPLGVNIALGVVAVPVAYLSWRYVEERFRRGSGQAWRPLVFGGAASMLTAATCAIGLAGSSLVPLTTTESVRSAASPDGTHATAFVPRNITPTLHGVSEDNPEIYANGCHLGFAETSPNTCAYGPGGDVPTVALFGDSHAAQWFPALHALAEDGKIRLIPHTKSSCPSAEVPSVRSGVPYVACETWRANVIDVLNSSPPDFVVVSNFVDAHRRAIGDTTGDRWSNGLSATLTQLPSSAEVIVLADTPNMRVTPAICLSANLDSADKCALPRPEALSGPSARADEQGARRANALFVDTSAKFCTEQCPAVIGNFLVYRDGHHMTATYSRALSASVEEWLSSRSFTSAALAR